MSNASMFRIGEIVALRSDPKIRFPVLEVVESGAECRYRVFQDGVKVTYYESQLQAVEETSDEKAALSIDELSARITALHLLSPSAASLISMRSGRVNFVPYQYRPVLKLIRSDRPRLLVADEVGVGKTIEAGLIIKELRARMDISSILVICPKALVAERKWFTEMKRFDEHFIALDGPRLRHCLHEANLDGEWPQQYANAILPFSLFDSELVLGAAGRRNGGQGLLGLDPAPAFDLVIVDEAHHIRNSETFLHQGVRYFCDNARAVVFLTATPVQLGSTDLFTLLNVLRPDLIIDQPSFEQMAAPNGFINAAVHHCRLAKPGWQRNAHTCLNEAAETEWGRLFLKGAPGFQAACQKLEEPELSDAERVSLTRALEEHYTFSSLINRTRRRDIGEFTTRKPQTVSVEFTPGQRQLHDRLLNVVARILARCHGQQNVKFMMTTLRRQAASCLYGLAPLLADILDRNLDRLELMEAADTEEEVDLGFVDEVRHDIQRLLEEARDLDPYDEKVQSFLRILREKILLPNSKALVFSTFRHTLAYLAKHAQTANLRFGLIHGDIPDEERAELRRRFAMLKEESDAIDILLSSEVGCEGLDFQFCDFLINYDLPWNPMKVEQRIGRIDRYGQKSDAVSIVNFITPQTVDADIYEKCLFRIGVFQHAVGGSEEILGAVTQELHDIAESFELTEDERAARLQQLADNGIRRIREDQELEEKQAELFGLNVPRAAWREEIEAADSEWLSSASIQRRVAVYLAARLGRDTEHLLGEKQLKTLRLSQEARHLLLNDYKALGRFADPVSREWEKWLKGSYPTLAVTFDQEMATEKPKVIHLSPLHPLVRQAAKHLEFRDPKYCAVTIDQGEIPAGDYRFALYRWTKQGIRPDEEMVCIADEPTLEGILLNILKVSRQTSAPSFPSFADCEALDMRHHAKWSVARAEHITANRELAAHRAKSLAISHLARTKIVTDQLDRTTNDKIRLMKQGELARAQVDYTRRNEEIRVAGDSGDIRSEAVLFGTVSVV